MLRYFSAVDGQPQIDARIEIDAPSERVWRVLTDFERYPEWNPFVPHVEARLEMGAAVRMRVNLVGSFELPQTEFITTLDPGRRICWTMNWLPAWLLCATRCQWLEPLSTGTRYVSTDTLTGLLAPLVVRVFGASMQRGFERTCRALKSRAETLGGETSASPKPRPAPSPPPPGA